MKPPTLRTDHAHRTLPVAGRATVLREVSRMWRTERRGFLGVALWQALAAAASLVGPFVIGQVVGEVASGRPSTDRITTLVLALGIGLLAQSALTWVARRAALVLAERLFAALRGEFMERSVALPLSVVERAGTGDLLARTTNDVDAVARVIREGLPSLIVALVSIVVGAAAAFLTAPLAALAILAAPLVWWWPTRRYLSRAGAGYLWEHAAYADLNGCAAETAEGAATMAALGLQEHRGRRFLAILDDCRQAERYTLRLRLAWFPWLELGFFTPVALVVLWGGYLTWDGQLSVAALTAVVLYVQQLLDPLGELLDWLDELQFAATSASRILGVAEVPRDRTPSGELPAGDDIVVQDVRYGYREGRDVLHGITLAPRPGERLTIVGPSGAGKSTLGRLMAGIDGPREGRVSCGGVRLVDLDLPVLRGEVALVTQEHHLFVGSLADNLALARPEAAEDELWAALRAVDAQEWAAALPKALATAVGSGGHALTEPQAQQVALARLVLADPHTLVLDEATSLLDPRAARHLERSLAAVMSGRTVVAIAHRLHTAHDADRVCVVEDGRVSELGSHAELLAVGKSYAALWRSWRDE